MFRRPPPLRRVTPYRAASRATEPPAEGGVSAHSGYGRCRSVRGTVLPLLPGPRFCPESRLRSMMGSGEVRSSKLTARA